MSRLDLTFVGSGDAFSSGGRLQSAILLETDAGGLLLDCGATLLAGLQRCGSSTERIDAVAISHLHGDHFGGLPFLLLDALFVNHRQKPLQVIGPPGTAERVATLCRTLYASALDTPLPFGVDYIELGEQPFTASFFRLQTYPARHGQHSAACSLRIDIAGRTLAYSGDTEWTEALVDLARNTDLLICECSSFDQQIPSHLDYQTLARHRARLETRRIILTHTGPSIDTHRRHIPLEVASDGLRLQL